MTKAKQAVKGSAKVGKACDCCHARKIKCNGVQPCNKCLLLDLPCRYQNVAKKKGPKGPSGRLPKALLNLGIRREETTSPAPSSSPLAATGYGLFSDGDFQVEDSRHLRNSSPSSQEYRSSTVMVEASERTASPAPPAHLTSFAFQPSPLLTLEAVRPYIEDFFKYKWTITPFMHYDTFQHNLESFLLSPRMYCLVASLCGSMIAQLDRDQQPTFSPEPYTSQPDTVLSLDFFTNEAKRVRLYFDCSKSPTLEDVQTSLFLYNAAHNRNQFGSAFLYIREAVTLIELLRLHRESTYQRLDRILSQFSRRTFWVVFISERVLALQQHQGLNLRASIELPSRLAEEIDSPVTSGFVDLIILWRHIDIDFIESWNNSPQIPSLPPRHLVARYEAMQESVATAIVENPDWSDAQRSDLILTQQWLKVIIWQLCIAQGLISSLSQKESMSFTYPIKIARETADQNLRAESLDPHGPGILEKIFDIGCCLVDVLQLNLSMGANNNPPSVEFGPKEPLVEFLTLCSTMRWGSTRYLPLLESKIEEYKNEIPVSPTKATTNSMDGLGIQEEQSFPPQGDNYEVPNWNRASQIWDAQAFEEMNHQWLESLSDPTYLDFMRVPGWEMSLSGL